MTADLWNFALNLYTRPGVEAACLELQAAGADVCLLLCGAWLGRRAVACTAPRLAQLEAVAQPWQGTVVTPLRQLRQAWRTAAATDAGLHALRERLKTLELEAERQLLQRLAAVSATWPQAAATDLPIWLEHLAATAGERSPEALHKLSTAAAETPLP